jgi:hypothetical protein
MIGTFYIESIMVMNGYLPMLGLLSRKRSVFQGVHLLWNYLVAESGYHFENIGFEVSDVYGIFNEEKYNIDSLD